MKERTINSSLELFEVLHDLKDGYSWAFRGQRDPSWKLLPKAGRAEYKSKFRNGINERSIFESWKRYAVHFLNQHPSDEWDWMVLAQHHGLATRLLDWTKNPLNAAYFAVTGGKGCSGAIFAFEVKTSHSIPPKIDPFEVKGLKVYYPRGLSPRIVSQRGIFTISNEPTKPIENTLDDKLHKFLISAAAAPEIRKTLAFFGINEMSIFQDLDHLSGLLNEFVLA